MYHIKEQVKTSETDLNEMEISDLLDRKFKTRATEAKRTVHKPNEISTKRIYLKVPTNHRAEKYNN